MQEVHAAAMAAQDELARQQADNAAQLQWAAAELDAMRAREARLVPDLERWLGLSAQLGALLAHARDIAAAAAEKLVALELASPADAAAEGGAAGGGAAEAEGGSGVTMVSEAQRLLCAFEATLGRAIPNLAVAGPWLQGLLRPLQASLAAIAKAADAPLPAEAEPEVAAAPAPAPAAPAAAAASHRVELGKTSAVPVPVEVTKVNVSLDRAPPPRPRMALSVDTPPPQPPQPPQPRAGSTLYEALGPAGTVQMAAEGTPGAVEALGQSRQRAEQQRAVDPVRLQLEQTANLPPASEVHHQFFPTAIRNALKEGARREQAQPAAPAPRAAPATEWGRAPRSAESGVPPPARAQPAEVLVVSSPAEAAEAEAEEEAEVEAEAAEAAEEEAAQAEAEAEAAPAAEAEAATEDEEAAAAAEATGEAEEPVSAEAAQPA